MPAPDTSEIKFVLDPDQDDDGTINDTMANMSRQFRGAYNRIPGTFTCAADAEPVCSVVATSPDENGQRILDSQLINSWIFESDDYVESSATQDLYHLYFGYWLKSPEDPNVPEPDYMFSAFSGGGGDVFEVPDVLRTTQHDDPLTATYLGGAAGRYVTKKLNFIDQNVDTKSPAYHGRFTANAELTANFGVHEDVTTDDQNTIRGTITDFRDGDDTDLGFKVTLTRQDIVVGSAIIQGDAGSATAVFSVTDTSGPKIGDDGGTWSAQFYGPTAAEATDTMAAEDPATILPSGVAGEFNVGTAHTRVVGAFAAEKK